MAWPLGRRVGILDEFLSFVFLASHSAPYGFVYSKSFLCRQPIFGYVIVDRRVTLLIVFGRDLFYVSAANTKDFRSFKLSCFLRSLIERRQAI